MCYLTQLLIRVQSTITTIILLSVHRWIRMWPKRYKPRYRRRLKDSALSMKASETPTVNTEVTPPRSGQFRRRVVSGGRTFQERCQDMLPRQGELGLVQMQRIMEENRCWIRSTQIVAAGRKRWIRRGLGQSKLLNL